MKKTVATLAFAITIGVGTAFGGFSSQTEAASISKLKGQQQKLEDQKSDVKSNLSDAKDKVNNIRNQQADVQSQMKRIDTALSDTAEKMDQKTAKIAETKSEITKLQAESKVIQERIAKRNELLKDRFRSYQETGGVVDYLDVLLGSTSFSDFVDRANAVATIMQADRDIIIQHEQDKEELEKKEAQVEKDLSSLKEMLSDLQVMKQQLNDQRTQKNQLLSSLKEKEKEAQEDVMDLSEQAQIIAAQESAIAKSIQLEKERQAREAAEAANSNSGSTGSGSTSSSGSAPQVSSGSWTRPAAGAITSTYKARWGKFHWGVDIAKPGTVPIVAAADGVVYVSHYSSSYGNVVYILHNINGQMYTTVYAHMRTRMVSSGAVVKKGQQIGIMGSTGDSTGQHLHFELYRGKWAYHSAINPMGIVPL